MASRPLPKSFVIHQDAKQMRSESIYFPRAELLNVARHEELLRCREEAGAGEWPEMMVERLTSCE